MARDPKVDTYIAAAAPFARPILQHLRESIHDAVDGLDEAIKWGVPHFVYHGKNLAGIAAFKAHCALVVHGAGRRGESGGMGHYGKITALSDMPGDNQIKAELVAACERIEAHRKSPRRPASEKSQPRPEPPLSPEFAAALEANPAAKAALAGFAPSHRREYVDWISEAKRPETRDKRIAQAIAQLAQGKKRYWKYDTC